MPPIIANWRTNLWAVILPLLYLAKYTGVDLHGLPLPPLTDLWPVIAVQFGLGISAKDHSA
jgi:hypothetical protein